MKKRILAMVGAALMCASVPAVAEIPLAYYSSLNGKCGQDLKTAVYQLVNTDVTTLGYGSGNRKTWWGFYVTDYQMDGSKRQVIDRYSNDIRYYGSRGESVSGMNIEHSFPKSWWGGSSTPDAYRDLYNLMPCEQKINSSKSNYGMGVVKNASNDNGCTKVGTGTVDGKSVKLWEPADKWKGDFARGYMYMATAYQNLTYSNDQAEISLTTGAYPTLKPWASSLYIQWAEEDAVDEAEIARNQAVAEIQGNRNPFIDFPNLMHYIWGDSISKPLNIATTVKAGQVTSGGETSVTTVVYDHTFTTSDDGDCTATGTADIWTVTEEYGWKGSAYFNNVCNVSDATLVTPVIDLTGATAAYMEFSHAGNKFNDEAVSAYCSVEISANGGTPETVTVPKWPAGTNWSFVNSGKVDLTAYAGKQIEVRFHYTSTAKVAGTWEIKSLKVCKQTSSGTIDTVIVPADPDADAPVEMYSLDGRRLDPETATGIVIVRRGSKAYKVIL